MELIQNKDIENNTHRTREREIAFIAASVAAGCISCLDYHKQQGLAIGLTKDEILKIARYANIVRRKAEEHNLGALDTILTGQCLRSLHPSEDPEDSDPTKTCC
ncbi:MAG: carboxymuconolactone decarboxylase family protein [Candidatus Heimdallarchaeota archaeon]